MQATTQAAPRAPPPRARRAVPRAPAALARPAPTPPPRGSVATAATGVAEREATRRGGGVARGRDRSAWVPPAAPVLSGSGGGIFFFWQLGE